MSTESSSLQDHFLIAMPALADPNFNQTVSYVCEHNADGAMGIVINRVMDLTMGEVLQHMNIPQGRADIAAEPIYAGGPVQQERGFVLHQPVGRWESSLRISDHIGVTTSRDIMEAIAAGEGPDAYMIALGYAGWGAGQLEQEMANNAWLSAPSNADIMFRTPARDRWRAAATLMGVNLDLMSGEVGHA